MAIIVQCDCGERLTAPESAAGKSGKCPACGRKVAIRESTDSLLEGSVVIEGGSEQESSEPTKHPPQVPIDSPVPSTAEISEPAPSQPARPLTTEEDSSSHKKGSELVTRHSDGETSPPPDTVSPANEPGQIDAGVPTLAVGKFSPGEPREVFHPQEEPSPRSPNPVNPVELVSGSGLPQPSVEHEPTVDQPSKKKKRSLNRWDQPFRSGADVVRRFTELVDELLALVQESGLDLPADIRSLKFAKSKYEAWLANSKMDHPNMFLAPSVQAAVAIATALEKSEWYPEAFWVSNYFGEMCKILIESHRKKYLICFERCLQVACSAISATQLAASALETRDEEESEIGKLAQRLTKVSDDALGTYFDNRSLQFRRTNRPETALGERVIHTILAKYFDARLRQLLRLDRPRVKGYVSANMPLVYRLKLSDDWAAKREEWERLIVEAGYEDVIRLLRDMGDLVSVDEVGEVDADRREDVRRAAANNDFNRVYELLADSAKELKSYLYSEAQKRLEFRAPPPPHLPDERLKTRFLQCQRLSRTNDPDKLRRALQIAQGIWQRDINNFELRDYVAFLQAKTSNLAAAEDLLQQIQKRRNAKQNFATDWNLAVLAYDRKEEATAYKLLVPLLDREGAD
ncbi:hypothetical protein MYX75_02270, partial [Acidobacteria bacterium AH-259-A15]|nr:hypothetical protein [Acidobacteria bacterium AH-259-A15]